MRADDIIKAVEKNAQDKKFTEEKEQALSAKKEEVKEVFYKCKQKCVCTKVGGKCDALDLKECSVCHSILKSQYGKQACKSPSGEKPLMLLVDAASKQPKRTDGCSYGSDDEEMISDMEPDLDHDDDDDDDDEMSDHETVINMIMAQKLRKVWKFLSPPNPLVGIIGNWYRVIYEGEKKENFVCCQGY